MVPSTVGGIIGLLVVLTPGIWYELVRSRSRPGRADSAFVEASRILFAGVLVSFVTLVLLGAASSLSPHVFAAPQQLFSKPDYVETHLWLVAWTLCCFFALAITLPAAWLYNTPGMNARKQLRPESLWVTYFDRIPALAAARAGVPPPEYVYLQVRVTSGDLFRGRLAGYSNDPEIGDRELTLAGGPKLLVKRKGAAWVSLSDEGWSFVLLKGEDIEEITALYYSPLGGKPVVENAFARAWSGVSGRLAPGRWLLVLLGAELAALLVTALATR